MLDTCCRLRLGDIAERELVEDITRNLGILVRVPQAIEWAPRIVGAWRGQFLMRRLHADSGGQCRKTQIERRKLHFHAAFLLLVGERLAYAIAGEIRRIGETDLVVLVVRCARPEPDHVDGFAVGVIVTFHCQLGLPCADARAVVFAVGSGDMIYAVVLLNGSADEAACEEI